ncbi:hypothetical protein RHMOL_Rhmol05G0201100 [Rhododendron molle]|uniref:Uncharacterized protein n=1 Tax=Rhododendron molle TaxID=49168 RepID=A0ACC0NSE3_RHOML|nr:hypothetical protein RHMOL_Rhmol05G0201100 [Rhododendron molle]
MANIVVCARFRPLSSKERRDHTDGVFIRSLDAETFVLKDEKQEEHEFSFDRAFYEGSEQADVYEFLALPIVRDAVNGINGTIITYGQGLSILDCDEKKKGLLPRVVDELFTSIKISEDTSKYTIKLSMVEIYMEKVRDLFDLSKDNIQIKESKVQGIILSGVTEISFLYDLEIQRGIANRAVGETQMNMASSRSHCVYIFTVQRELITDKRSKTGKLVLVDLAGSEKIEKTGAEGIVLEEAKTINKSLSALGNVINALTSGTPSKANHIPYRDSKLTRILQDALGGNSRTALLCCCSPSPSNASESLSTLRFGARAKHIKASPRVSCKDDKYTKKVGAPTPLPANECCQRILEKLRDKMDVEDVNLLEECFIQEGILFDINSVEDLESAYEDVTCRTISSLQQAVEELVITGEELMRENKALKARLEAAERSLELREQYGERISFADMIKDFGFFIPWFGSVFRVNNVE